MKGQVAAEFMIILSVLLILLLFIIDFSYSNDGFLKVQEARLSARHMSLELAAGINSIHFAGDGAFDTIQLPTELEDGTSYNISIYGASHVVDIVWDKAGVRSYQAPIIPGLFNGTTTGLNGQINLTNAGGTIQIDS